MPIYVLWAMDQRCFQSNRPQVLSVTPTRPRTMFPIIAKCVCHLLLYFATGRFHILHPTSIRHLQPIIWKIRLSPRTAPHGGGKRARGNHAHNDLDMGKHDPNFHAWQQGVSRFGNLGLEHGQCLLSSFSYQSVYERGEFQICPIAPGTSKQSLAGRGGWIRSVTCSRSWEEPRRLDTPWMAHLVYPFGRPVLCVFPKSKYRFIDDILFEKL